MVLGKKLSIAIPASLVSGIPHLREKTSIVGMVGRAAAIFGVVEIIVFPDLPRRNQSRELDLLTRILTYMETPQYLRKKLFRIRPELRYAGVLPPLRTPHHPLSSHVKDLVDGEHREGIAVSHTKSGTLVDVGVEKHVLVRNRKLPIGVRATFRIKVDKQAGRLLEAAKSNRSRITEYWGFQVTRSQMTLGTLLKKRVFDLVIATSRRGKPFLKVSERLRSSWQASLKPLICFGAPTQGLYEIAQQENFNLNNVVDFVVNTVPFQEVETVRTEEAIFVTLGVLNSLEAKG